MEQVEKKYGIFDLNMTSNYYDDGLHQIRLTENYLYEDEETAIEFLRWKSVGHYVILPIYIKTKIKDEKEILFEMKIKFLEDWQKALKDKKP
jgi:hypothetical protein